MLHRIIKIFYGISCNRYRYAIVFLPEFCKHLGDEIALRRVRDADAQACEPPVGGLQIIEQLLFERLHAPDILNDDFSLRCQRYFALCTHEKRHAELLLELADVVTDSRLREIERGCRAREASKLRCGEKRAKLWIQHTKHIHSENL